MARSTVPDKKKVLAVFRGRFEEYLEYKGIESVSEFCKVYDIEYNTIYRYFRDKKCSQPGLNWVVKLAKECRDLDMNWLLTGEGKMIKQKYEKNEELHRKGVPYYF